MLPKTAKLPHVGVKIAKGRAEARVPGRRTDEAQYVIEIGPRQLSGSCVASTDLLEQRYKILVSPALTLAVPRRRDFTATAPSSRLFWKFLGFEYATIGLGDSIKCDLNTDQVSGGVTPIVRLGCQYGRDKVVNQALARGYRKSNKTMTSKPTRGNGQNTACSPTRPCGKV
jgi:hypothetical protein